MFVPASLAPCTSATMAGEDTVKERKKTELLHSGWPPCPAHITIGAFVPTARLGSLFWLQLDVL